MNTKGIGLGLAICQKIVHQFEGEVDVKSVYQQGSTFSFSFKLEESGNDNEHLPNGQEQYKINCTHFYYAWRNPDTGSEIGPE